LQKSPEIITKGKTVEISIREDERTAIITLQGNIVGGPDAVQLNEKLHELGDKGIKRAIVDLSGVIFMNSSGLGMLIGGLTAMRNIGGDLKIVQASPKIETLLAVAKIQSLFPNYSSIEQAKNSFT